MRLKCLHGFYMFSETNAAQVADFSSYTGIELGPKDDFFTFDKLIAAPDFSINGADLLGFTANKTFEGKPWEVFEANGIVYDFTSDSLKTISSITNKVRLSQSGYRFISDGLILAGSVTANGKKIKSFDAWYTYTRRRWLYSEVTFV